MIFHFLKKKRHFSLSMLITILMLFSQIALISTNNQLTQKNDVKNPNLSAQISGTKEWLNNSDFDSPIEPWYSTIEGDVSDVTASNNSGVANYEILGEEHIYSDINGTPTTAKGWTKSKNYQYPAEPNQGAYMTAYGGFAHHHWSESADQQVIVQWDKQISLSYNMSDYYVTAASLNMTVNGTVHADAGYTGDDSWGGLEISASESSGGTQYNVGDFVRFFIGISDQNKEKNYTDVISYKPIGLGDDKGGSIPIRNYDYLYATVIEVDDENDLINLLNNLFHYYNNYNITITIGMFLNCEDNWSSDDDFFEGIYITSVNFTFTYKKNIDQGTKISWNQDGKRIRELSPENYTVVATEANLRFDYKIDTDWASNTSSINSELRVLLNGYDHKITIKLIDVNLTSETANFKLLNLPTNSVNLSIQVYLRDEFRLDRNIIISIDNATLDISYIIFAPDLPSGDGGGGGGTKYIRGEDYTWLVILLTAGIIALVTTFVAYQKHYKYPPIVRKIRALKKKIRKGKKTKPMLLNTREELIRKNFKNQTNLVMETELKPESIDKLKKGGE